MPRKESIYDGALIVQRKAANSSFNENYSIPAKGQVVIAYNNDTYLMKVGNGKDIFLDLNVMASTDGSSGSVDLSQYAKKKDLDDYVTITNFNTIIKSLNTKIDNVEVDLNYANETEAGIVKIDNKTIIINEDGVISAVNSGSETGSSVLTEDLQPNQTVGGVSSSNNYPTGTSLENIIRDMLIKEIAPEVKITLTPQSGFKEKGTAIVLTNISVNITKNSAKSIKNIEVYNGTKLLTTVTGTTSNTYNVTSKLTINTDTDINVKINYIKSNDLESSITKTESYKFANGNYYGVLSSIDEINETNITKLTKNIVGNIESSYTYTTEKQLMLFAYPSEYGEINSVIDTNTGYKLNWTKKILTINKVNYNCYYSTIGKVTNYNIKFN